MSAGASPPVWVAWVNGRLCAPDEPAIAVADEGFQLGLAVFDTLLFEDGCLYFVEDHLARLERGARELGIDWPPPHDPLDAAYAVVDACGVDRLALRLTLTRGAPGAGPTLAVASRAVAVPPDPGVTVAVAADERMAGDDQAQVKSTNRLAYVRAREAAQRQGAWDALIPTHEGDLVEGTICNLFAAIDGELVTPSAHRGCLEGVVRGRILDELERESLRLPDGRVVPLRVDRIERGALARADEVMLTNTTGRVLPVVAVLGLGPALPGADGAVTRALRERVRALEARYRAEHPRPARGEAARR